jgi:hypothetical protein
MKQCPPHVCYYNMEGHRCTSHKKLVGGCDGTEWLVEYHDDQILYIFEEEITIRQVITI